MAIPAKQIGWSQKANLLWQISKQLEYLTGVLYKSTSSTTTTSTTTVSPTTTTTTTTSSTSSTTTTTTTATPTTTTTTTASPTTTTTTTAFSYAIGSPYEGGVIAYVLQPGDPGYDAGVPHGLIATVNDTSTGIEWGCMGTSIVGTSSSLGTGSANTIAIMNGCSILTSPVIAARLCDDLVEGGYNDWYLPSLNELLKLYNNRVAIGNFNLSGASYWSSTQDTGMDAFNVFFNSGTSSNGKAVSYRVRAVRSF